jgi:hypothetical protein
LQIVQKVDHLRLDRDVECGDRLVADDQARVERERAGDADALALAAGEFVRGSGRAAAARKAHLEGAFVERAGARPVQAEPAAAVEAAP